MPRIFDCKLRQERLEATKEKRAKLAKIQKEIYNFRKANRLCVRCGSADALNGRVLCADCRMFYNQTRSGYVEHTQKWHEKERKAGRL